MRTDPTGGLVAVTWSWTYDVEEARREGRVADLVARPFTAPAGRLIDSEPCLSDRRGVVGVGDREIVGADRGGIGRVPLTVKSLALIDAGSIGSENVSEKVVGAVPVTTEPAAGSLEMTVGASEKWEIQVAQLAGTPESRSVAYSAPPQKLPSPGSTAMPL